MTTTTTHEPALIPLVENGWGEMYFPQGWTFTRVCAFMADPERGFFSYHQDVVDDLIERHRNPDRPHATQQVRWGLFRLPGGDV